MLAAVDCGSGGTLDKTKTTCYRCCFPLTHGAGQVTDEHLRLLELRK